MKKIKASVIGASGYTGAELIRLLYNHKNVEIVSLIAERNAGNPIGDIYSHFSAYSLPDLISLNQADWSNVDVAFCCLPHATTQEVVKTLPSHLKVIDLSADFRLSDVNLYKEWYGHTHAAPDLQKEAVYGLSEIFRKDIEKARLVACPGCYPTSSLLPLMPLLQAKLISTDDIIIDSKSGVTGAGRSEKVANLFCEVNEGVKAYSVCKHRHMPEIEQGLQNASGSKVKISFTPHLIPMNRGIISTIYVNLEKGSTVDKLRSHLENFYKEEQFVYILPKGKFPCTRDVYGTNYCHIAVTEAGSDKRAVIVSVIDNLAKGASGQAVQNMNIMFGFNEVTGLEYTPLFP